MLELHSDEPRRRVLIIDDDAAASGSLAAMLTHSGYEATVVEKGSLAKLKWLELRPDLVILDVMLHDVDGLMLCAEIQHSGIPVIVCSATRRHQDRVLALRLGADDFIAKPFDQDEMKARVAAVLRRVMSPTRQAPDEPEPLRIGSLVVDPSRHLVAVGKQELRTTP